MENQLETKALKISEIIAHKPHYINGPAYEVAKRFRKKGYDISGHGGVRAKQKHSSDFIGILKDRKPLEKKFLGIKYKKTQRALHLGTLWFNSNKKDANENENWTLEVYGRKYLDNLTKLVGSFSRPYNVGLKVNLKSEFPIEESYISDLI